MKHDILLNIKNELTWVCDIYQNDLNDAIQDAIESVGSGKYVGHKSFKVVEGVWVEA